jgi:hypothetical protein
MKIIKSKLTKYVLFASFFTILIIFHSSNALATLLPKGYIDTPTVGSSMKGVSNVSGWFLDGSGVAKIEIVVDGKVMGQAQYGTTRLDVGDKFPDYKNANSGFQYSLNTMNLTNGQHSLTVRETGNNGITTTLSSRIVYVQNLPAKGSIDAPTNGSLIKGTTVSGWFLDGSQS